MGENMCPSSGHSLLAYGFVIETCVYNTYILGIKGNHLGGGHLT